MLEFRGVLLAAFLMGEFGAHREFTDRRSNVVDAGGVSDSQCPPPFGLYAATRWVPGSTGLNPKCFSATEQLVAQPYHRIVFPVGHAFLHWDQRVVGDLDAFRADFGA